MATFDPFDPRSYQAEAPIAGWLKNVLTSDPAGYSRYDTAPGWQDAKPASVPLTITPQLQQQAPQEAPGARRATGLLGELDGDANPVPGGGLLAGMSRSDAASTPQQSTTMPSSKGPGLIERLARTNGAIGGVANLIGAITGQTGGAIDPATSQGPAGQIYRMMIGRGVNPQDAKFFASRQDTAMAWLQKNMAPQTRS